MVEAKAQISTPQWLVNAMTTIGSVAIAALMGWMATSQVETNTNVAVILEKLDAKERLYEADTDSINNQLSNLLSNQNRIWPRIRAHGENIEILRAEIEGLTKRPIKLAEPEPY